MCHDNEKLSKNWRGIDLSVQNWHEEIRWILIQAIENLQNLHYNGLPLTKVYTMFELKQYRGVMFDGTEYWCKIWTKTDFCFQKWHEKFEKFSPETWKSQNWDFDDILLSKVGNVWA